MTSTNTFEGFIQFKRHSKSHPIRTGRKHTTLAQLCFRRKFMLGNTGLLHTLAESAIPSPRYNLGFCVPDIVDDFKDGYLFKSVWSGSGKGLRWCRRGLTKSTADWCRRELVNHGALILEPIYKKEGDFAMEFYSNGRGKVLFSGYSHFITDEKGVYRGNMLVSNEEVEQWILRYIPLEAFVCIREYLQKVIEGIYGRYYSGPMGIDMMICPDQRGYPYAIYPHVEINVRMTMGMVARQLYDNFVAPGSKGIFNVDNFPSAEALRTQHEQDMRDYPLIVEEGRIVSGYLALVPVTPQSRYRAYVRVEVR